MLELVMKMFGLSGFVRGGQVMVECLNKLGVKNIKVVGCGVIIVDIVFDFEKLYCLRKVVCKYVE